MNDRDALRNLATELSAALSSPIHKDKCGDWCLFGKRGRVWHSEGKFYLFFAPGTERRWNSLKRRLAFCRVSQDGDDEGILILDSDLDELRRSALRRELGLRPAPSPATLEHLKRLSEKNGFKPRSTP